MPPITIVQDINKLLKSNIIPAVPTKWIHQFDFGVKAFGLRPFTSANGNARMVTLNPNTASTKCDRLLSNKRLANKCGNIFDNLNIVSEKSFVNVDHSDMNGLMALVGAAQTRKGRAVPCFIETTYSPSLPAFENASLRKKRLRKDYKEERKEISFTRHTIDSIQDFHDRLGFWPKLVFDRGFGNKSLIVHLIEEKATFYIRLKKGRLVEFDKEKTEVKKLSKKDTNVSLFGLNLRVVSSPITKKHPEPWYILTNDFLSSEKEIIRIYYHRFEIEETFRDIKHIFEFKRTRLNKPNSLKIILWLISIGIALLYLASRKIKRKKFNRNKKKQRSWLREAYELFQYGSGSILWGDG